MLTLYAGLMHQDGSLTLTDVRSPTLSIVCEACTRRRRYTLARLIDEYGDEKLTQLLRTLASCRKSHSLSTHDGCKLSMRGLHFTTFLGLANVLPIAPYLRWKQALNLASNRSPALQAWANDPASREAAELKPRGAIE